VLEMQRSEGLHEMGYPKWQLVLCLLIVYSMLYLSLFKGVKSSGTRTFHLNIRRNSIPIHYDASKRREIFTPRHCVTS
jgi:hypothetical protein